jgi:hypothetical protein
MIGLCSAAIGILLALAAPAAAELIVMQLSQEVRVMVETIRGPKHGVVVVAMISCGRLFLRPLADDAQFLTAQLCDFS